MLSPAPANTLRQARQLVEDLYPHNLLIYWSDFLLSLIVGYSAASLYLAAPWGSWRQVICFTMAGVALYRLGSFTHEIVHFRRDEMRLFRHAWNLLAGVPMLTPTFFYESHLHHHNTHHYGTAEDGEYLPLSRGRWTDAAVFVLLPLLQPIAVTLRFLLAPLTFLHPALRRWTLEHASSFVINLHYRRRLPRRAMRRSWALMDLACSARAWLIFVLIFLGETTWMRIPQLYFLAVFILSLNYLRTLAAHRYLSDGQALTHEDQLYDSTNITGGSLLTWILCPLGMQYHALHHLFPRLPYHNFPKAHRRLMENLPDNSSYRQTEYPSWLAVIRQLLQDVRSPSVP
ncbi:fatty acid desaturase family protein [Lignipirellula cremea]|uniref:Fatty acid desaturase n=1 Tax=Lignipirellula cremea TaxID=2528010 RepID=A0A518E4G8_9BACT|nr:fatty acid desaturase [Lignipirellula cremea]QDU98974.1 Fatty acid desaturase [Lignipirellula cremea]